MKPPIHQKIPKNQERRARILYNKKSFNTPLDYREGGTYHYDVQLSKDRVSLQGDWKIGPLQKNLPFQNFGVDSGIAFTSFNRDLSTNHNYLFIYFLEGVSPNPKKHF